MNEMFSKFLLDTLHTEDFFSMLIHTRKNLASVLSQKHREQVLIKCIGKVADHLFYPYSKVGFE